MITMRSQSSGGDEIFARYAPLYRPRGLSVIAISPGTKHPAAGMMNWSGYCDNLPNQETFDAWLERYRYCGIGLCLGTRISDKFRIGAVDVDNEAFEGVTRAILGSCPCGKRGARGITYFVRTPVAARYKSTALYDFEKHGAIDVLIGGKMTVLPPSIHPDTNNPYEWVGASLMEIDFNDLPILD